MISVPLNFNHVTLKQIVLAEFHQNNVSFKMMKQENKIKVKTMCVLLYAWNVFILTRSMILRSKKQTFISVTHKVEKRRNSK